MLRLLSEPRKPIFTPDDLISSYGIGIPFDAYGKTFLFVGTMDDGDHTVSTLAIWDWSKGGFTDLTTSHAYFPIDAGDFIAVDDRYISFKRGLRPVHALVDPKAILSLLSQVRSSSVDELPPVLLELERKIASPEPKL